jgi:hypothetical protein
MFRSWTRLYPATAARRRTARRPGSFRPAVEALEAREVPAQFSSSTGAQAVAAIDPATHHAMVHTPAGWTDLGLDIAADVSLDVAPNGNVNVFVRTAVGQVIVWQGVNHSSAWSFYPLPLGSPPGTSISEISAGPGGCYVFGIAADGHVWGTGVWGFTGWYNLGSPARGGSVQHISAGLDNVGSPVVFAIASDGYIYGHNSVSDPGGVSWYLVDGSARFTQLSATTHNGVFTLDQSGSVHQAGYVAYWGPRGVFQGWVDWAFGRPPSGNTAIALSAASYGYGDEVYVIDSNHDVYVHHPNGWQNGGADYGISEIAAIGNDVFFDVYATPSANYPYFITGSYWQSNQYLGGFAL